MNRIALLGSILVLLATLADAQAVRTIVVQGTATALDDSLQIGFHPPGTHPACGTYFDCNGLLLFCTDEITGSPGDDAATFAASIAAAISAPVSLSCNPNPGFSATANGSVVTVTYASDFEMCLASVDEMQGCGTPLAQSLAMEGCAIHNLCNGVPCDETLAHTSGFSLSTALGVPGIDGVWALVLVAGALVTGSGLLGRRTL